MNKRSICFKSELIKFIQATQIFTSISDDHYQWQQIELIAHLPYEQLTLNDRLHLPLIYYSAFFLCGMQCIMLMAYFRETHIILCCDSCIIPAKRAHTLSNDHFDAHIVLLSFFSIMHNDDYRKMLSRVHKWQLYRLLFL